MEVTQALWAANPSRWFFFFIQNQFPLLQLTSCLFTANNWGNAVCIFSTTLLEWTDATNSLLSFLYSSLNTASSPTLSSYIISISMLAVSHWVLSCLLIFVLPLQIPKPEGILQSDPSASLAWLQSLTGTMSGVASCFHFAFLEHLHHEALHLSVFFLE